jgi:hypothetical protein
VSQVLRCHVANHSVKLRVACGANFVYFCCCPSLALVTNFTANLHSIYYLVSNTASQHPAATSLNNSFYILFNANIYTSFVISGFIREVDGTFRLYRNIGKNLPLLAAGKPKTTLFASITDNFPSSRLIDI